MLKRNQSKAKKRENYRRARERFLISKFWILGIFTVFVGAASFAADAPYHFIKQIPISGEGGWDYLSVDSAARRLYVTHATKVVVIDVDKDAVTGEIADTPGVHGLAMAPN